MTRAARRQAPKLHLFPVAAIADLAVVERPAQWIDRVIRRDDSVQNDAHLAFAHDAAGGLDESNMAVNEVISFYLHLADIYSPRCREDPSNPFNETVPRYDAESVDTHMADALLLCDLPGRSGGCGGSIATGQWGGLRITLRLRNAPVYRVLNAIVAQNGCALWVPIARGNEHVSGIRMNFWYIYPLDPAYEGTAASRLQALRPSR